MGATTYVPAKDSAGGGGVWGAITGTLADQTDLKAVTDNKVDKISGKGLSTNDYTDADEAKIGNISVTQAVDLDTMESDITTNNAKVTALATIQTRTASFATATGNQYNKCNSATNINATLNAGIPVGATVVFSQANTGEVTFVAGSSVTIEPTGKKLVEGSATAICIATNTYRLDGNLEDV